MTRSGRSDRQERRLPQVPLLDSEMSPAVLRTASAQAPAPMRQMAARGLAPLPPHDLVTALYQLAVTGDEALSQTAQASAAKLPEPVLRSALQGALDARVLDFLARALHSVTVAVDLILRHRGLHDLTTEYLATVCGGEALDVIATDEVRLLRSPSIIAAFYMNPRARASTALRLIELAARNHVVVDIPGFEDLVASLNGVTISAADDARYEATVGKSDGPAAEDGSADRLTQEDIEKTQSEEEAKAAGEGEEPEKKKKRFEELPVPFQIRAATLGNAFDRSVAIRSTIRLVCMAAIRSPALSINEVVKFASNRALQEDVIRYISNQKDWTQLAAVRLALINNNKCPLGTAMRFLNFLNARDLKGISRSKNVPSALTKAAKALIAKREQR